MNLDTTLFDAIQLLAEESPRRRMHYDLRTEADAPAGVGHENWKDMSQKHQAIYQGLGGSFDVYTGTVERAPEWWVKHNLEWAYRLIKQSSRIKRQIHLVRFWFLVKLGKI